MIVTVASPIRNCLVTSYAEAIAPIINKEDKIMMRFILDLIKGA